MYRQILVPVDLNDKGFSDKAVELAVWHAKNSNAEIHLLNVLPGIHMSMVASYFPKDAANQMKQDVKRQLQEFADKYIDDEVIHGNIFPISRDRKTEFTIFLFANLSRKGSACRNHLCNVKVHYKISHKITLNIELS